ncbi:hypothetical protein SAMN05421806_105433 [Streptomyces indicus]|uniref:Uncharacterized protein n=1 Tax=Streptomyces indicus TaxID=417292 RepID=A0A1G9A919_9ACTN|nr:hypothetical protein SAMN05421806_105433 [Streptomyces indicus]
MELRPLSGARSVSIRLVGVVAWVGWGCQWRRRRGLCRKTPRASSRWLGGGRRWRCRRRRRGRVHRREQRAATSQSGDGEVGAAPRRGGVVALIDESESHERELLHGELPVAQRVRDLVDLSRRLRGCVAERQFDAVAPVESCANRIVLHLLCLPLCSAASTPDSRGYGPVSCSISKLWLRAVESRRLVRELARPGALTDLVRVLRQFIGEVHKVLLEVRSLRLRLAQGAGLDYQRTGFRRFAFAPSRRRTGHVDRRSPVCRERRDIPGHPR